MENRRKPVEFYGFFTIQKGTGWSVFLVPSMHTDVDPFTLLQAIIQPSDHVEIGKKWVPNFSGELRADCILHVVIKQCLCQKLIWECYVGIWLSNNKGLSRPLAATMTSMGSLETSSRVWSCSTLRNGVNDVVEKAQKLEVEEVELMKKIQDRGSSCP